MTYTFKKYKDVYTILNTGAVNITYTLSKKGCGYAAQVSTGSIAPNQTVTLPILYIDGTYQVTVSDSISVETLPDILFYNNFLLYIIDSISTVYCKCSTCNDYDSRDCDGAKCNAFLTLLTSTNTYFTLDYPSYTSYLSKISSAVKCDLDLIVNDFTTGVMITGDEEIIASVNQMIAYYYYTFYIKEMSFAIDAAEKDYITEKFKFNTISQCFKRIGIDTEAIIATLKLTTVFYWQEPNDTTDITSIMATLTQPILNSHTHDPIAVFNEGKTVTLGNTARMVFVLQESVDGNYHIYDSLNNDITAAFDYQHHTGLKAAVFVSINPIAPGMYNFKIKSTT